MEIQFLLFLFFLMYIQLIVMFLVICLIDWKYIRRKDCVFSCIVKKISWFVFFRWFTFDYVSIICTRNNIC